MDRKVIDFFSCKIEKKNTLAKHWSKKARQFHVYAAYNLHTYYKRKANNAVDCRTALHPFSMVWKTQISWCIKLKIPGIAVPFHQQMLSLSDHVKNCVKNINFENMLKWISWTTRERKKNDERHGAYDTQTMLCLSMKKYFIFKCS